MQQFCYDLPLARLQRLPTFTISSRTDAARHVAVIQLGHARQLEWQLEEVLPT